MGFLILKDILKIFEHIVAHLSYFSNSAMAFGELRSTHLYLK
jgi:hypothetical protein